MHDFYVYHKIAINELYDFKKLCLYHFDRIHLLEKLVEHRFDLCDSGI